MQTEPSQARNGLLQSARASTTSKGITLSDVLQYFTAKRNTILLAICLLLLILFVLLTWWVYKHPVWFIDVSITHELQDHRDFWLRDGMIAVSYLGNKPLLFHALVLLTALIFYVVRLRLEAIMLVGSFEVSRYLNEFLKSMMNRPRPTPARVVVIEVAAGASFPSGHVMSYVAFWGFLFLLAAFVLKGKRWWRTAILIISGLFVVLVGPSPIYLGDHWATDVAGAYLLEGVLLGIAFLLYYKLRDKKVRLKELGMQVIKRVRDARIINYPG